MRSCLSIVFFGLLTVLISPMTGAGVARAQDEVTQGTRLLRQPTISALHIAFTYGSDLWIVERGGGLARRLTSTPAVESNPHFSPDGRWIAFSSNRAGNASVYVVAIEGGTPKRLTWYPSDDFVRGWTPDGTRVLYASERETAPAGYERLWTVSPEGGPSQLLPAPRAHDGSFSADGRRLIVDRVSRWDVEWRGYRGGQNTALTILALDDLSETYLPNERTTDVLPVWLGDQIFFLSDRDEACNVWSYELASGALRQVTRFVDADVKWLAGHGDTLIFEQDGWLFTLQRSVGRSERLNIEVRGDFPWAEIRWEDVSKRARAASLSPSGKRALFEARGEVFTVPVEKGPVRNLTQSSGAADRAPLWSPDGQQVAWFSDSGDGYALLIAAQDGLSPARRLAIGESKMVWEPAWSPDGSRIAFVDDDVRVRVIELHTGRLTTVDIGGANIERGSMGLVWSPDSQWLAYAKTGGNNLRRIVVWSRAGGTTTPLTDVMADARSPAWDRGGRHLFFLASTEVALASGWANTSSMVADPEYGVYAVVLRAADESPFLPQSDEEGEAATGKAGDKDAGAVKKADEAQTAKSKKNTPVKPKESVSDSESDTKKIAEVVIDTDGIDRRIISLPMPVARYVGTLAGPEGTLFVAERLTGGSGQVLHKFTMKDREAKVFVSGVQQAVVSADGENVLLRKGEKWSVAATAGKNADEAKTLDVALTMRLDRLAEWRQIFNEAWHYERDFFYDPGHHGNDWNEVRRRYAPLVPYVRHRADLNYVLDQINGELSVGHSFIFGGDLPEVDDSKVGVLGADLVIDRGFWRIDRIYTFESWNPTLNAPLDRPGLEVETGRFVVGVNGVELRATDDPYRLLDGTAGKQTVLQINNQPSLENSWRVTVEPLANEATLRQRAWVEDNRRRVDEQSGGLLAYVWVPNTGGVGVVSFDRYYFAQQDKLGAVIDERFNGGGLLDDYMVDLMTRSLRAAITNEVPEGRSFRLPAGILGPKVLLINELSGSGGDFFPWVFRQQHVGPLIGTRTWGGLVKSSVHYALVDGGALTAPDNAVFDPINHVWVAENEGVPPDIEVVVDAKSAAEGRDPQLERGVAEALRLLAGQGEPALEPPPFPRPSKRPGR